MADIYCINMWLKEVESVDGEVSLHSRDSNRKVFSVS